MKYFDVLIPGMMSTLQDNGRQDYQDRGVPPSGVMDSLSYALANALVANPENTGVIEFTLTGPKIQLCGDESCLFAITGDAIATLNDQTCQPYRSYQMLVGDILHIKALRSGARGYLAISGGFDIKPQLGSVSTLVRARLGGFEGRPLQKHDHLPLGTTTGNARPSLCTDHIFPQREKRPVRVVWGPQDEYFDDAAREIFLGQAYSLSPACDRMGYRLHGEPLSHVKGFNIISDAISHGSIQIPGDGLPIIAMNDRQTTGGYPKIATVIRADLARLGQLKPGDQLRFEAVSVSKAEDLWRGRQEALRDKIKGLCRK